MQLRLLVPNRFRWVLRSRSAQLATLVTGACLFVSLVPWIRGPGLYQPQTHFLHLDLAHHDHDPSSHPIERLVADSHATHQGWLKRSTLDLHTAADLYRDRRGRHPPPGFDAWFAYAQQHDAIVVESFFDRIEADIGPFWGLDPRHTAELASQWHSTISVRDGVVTAIGKLGNHNTPFLKIWRDLVDEAGPSLPNVNMPINNLDEARVMMPWADVDNLMQRGRASRQVLAVQDVLSNYTSDIPIVTQESSIKEPGWISTGMWDMVRAACPERTGGRNMAQTNHLSDHPQFIPEALIESKYSGYIKNFTAAKDLCELPHLSGFHAQLIQPSTMLTTTDAFPIFSGCKMLANNDILLPGAAYIGEFSRTMPWSSPHYNAKSTTSIPWRRKVTGLFWRGITSGGLSSEDNWHRFHRFRLVEMLNGTHVSLVEQGKEEAKSFDLPSSDSRTGSERPITYPGLIADLRGKIGPWLESLTDVGFTRFFCYNGQGLDGCSFLKPHFALRDEVSMSKQFRYKFLPDTDGNSYSGRYRSFLLSTSLPIKSTLFAEWHDDRLLPWLHFVPSEVENQDLYAILHFFTNTADGDRVAQYIAEQGAAWAARVLRREDMLLYTWRVLLEFARVCDENRDRLGFVGDLA